MSKPDILLVSESDHYLPQPDQAVPFPFQPLTEYLNAPLKELDLPFQYQLTAPQRLPIAVLCAAIKAEGFNPENVDNIFRSRPEKERFLRLLREKPAVVGISTACLRRAVSVKFIVDAIREHSPASLVVLGGSGAETSREMRDLADVTVTGSGERAIIGILREVRKASSPREITGKVPGGAPGARLVRCTDHYESGRESISPDWGAIAYRPSSCYSVQASRGCTHNCVFCGYSGKGKQVYRDPASVAAEAAAAAFRHNARHINFVDSNLTSDPDFISRLSSHWIAAGITVPWSCFARIDDIAKHPRIAEDMAKAGCIGIYAGIETASDAILVKMRKGFDKSLIPLGLRKAKDAGLSVHANFIIGFPGETVRTVAETLEFIEKHPIDTVSLSTLGLTAEMKEYASGHRHLLNGFDGGNGGWTHETMTSGTAAQKARDAIALLAASSRNAVLASHGLAVYYLLGGGLSWNETLDYFKAIRSYHAASRHGDIPLRDRHLDVIRRLYTRSAANFRTEGGHFA